MFLTVHAASGILIGQYTDNVWLAFILGIISHLLLDIIPHGDENLVKDQRRKYWMAKYAVISAIDTFLVVFMTYLLWQNNYIKLTPAAIAALFGSLLPDYIWGLSEITHSKSLKYLSQKIFAWFHDLLNIRLKLASGLLIQTLVLLLFIILLIK
jgi:hypothetical protein